MSSDPPTIGILMPVYNGAAFLPEQLKSLLQQSCATWHCYIRDDSSTDATPEVARKFVREHPDRFQFIEDKLGNLGVVGCLNELAKRVDEDYFALCDQDDVWLPEKLARSVAALLALKAPPDVPALAYCDMKVTDSRLNLLADSFWDMQKLRRYAVGLRGMPVLNAVAGCAMVGNRALMTTAFPVPASAPMHDHWIALVARFAGVHAAIEESLILYRQHGRNQRGAVPPSSQWSRILRRTSGPGRFVSEARLARTARLAMFGELLERHLPSTRVADCRAAMQAETSNPLSRLAFLVRSGISPARAFTYWMA